MPACINIILSTEKKELLSFKVIATLSHKQVQILLTMISIN